jgi:hypothetical protein
VHVRASCMNSSILKTNFTLLYRCLRLLEKLKKVAPLANVHSSGMKRELPQSDARLAVLSLL